MRYDTDHKQKTRERVLKEAAKAIRADGPHKIGVAGIMAEAGLTHGGFYAHFASKDELVAAAIEQMFAEGRDRLSRETENRGPAEGLAAYIDFYLSAAHRDSRTAGCPLPFLSADMPRLDQVARENFAAGVARLSGKLADSLSKLGHDHAEDEAASLLAEMVGAVSLARAEPDRAKSDAMLTRVCASVKRRLGLETRQ